ncbi:MFS transporter [Xylanibacter muris]|nr:MFS transporter [Xylanibacter muris]
MEAQSSIAHIRLWHRDFWFMVIANYLMTSSVYMLLPILPLWLKNVNGFGNLETGAAMGVFGLGLVCFGPLCSFLIQKYRRNIVCVCAVFFMALSVFAIHLVENMEAFSVTFEFVLCQRFLLGAAFGLAQMVLISTLIIDTCESCQRTEANYGAAWFSRFAMSLGPLTGIVCCSLFDFDVMLWVAVGSSLLAIFMIVTVRFPFRAPADNIPLFSLDRFFLLRGFPLFINLFLLTAVVGIMFSCSLTEISYTAMMGGFLLSLVARRFVFQNAELKSEAVCGMILVVASYWVLLSPLEVAEYISPFLFGTGLGILGSCFLLLFVKLSNHCQRGTSQSTFMIAWEGGVAFGLFIGHSLLSENKVLLAVSGIGITVVAMLVYILFTHKWFTLNKNR